MKLVIIRGLPGSGKTTKAQDYVAWGYDHFEADMYFIGNDGKYHYNPRKIKQAHQWCKDMCADSLKRRKNVVISNTFTRLWEMKDYVELAKKYKAELEIIECKENYGNIHGVPEEKIKEMSTRWEELQ